MNSKKPCLHQKLRRTQINLPNSIDAPESSQDFGSRPKQSLSDLVFGKTVTVISSKKDRYGRTLGKVTLDGRDINLEQILVNALRSEQGLP
jgi:endonuclease YncB( thermonuclease family)